MPPSSTAAAALLAAEIAAMPLPAETLCERRQ